MVDIAFALLAALAVVPAQGTAAKTETIEPVAVVGCLKEPRPGTWMLVNAGDPVASTANAPSAKELAALPKSGKNEFQLIGVSIFNLPAHRDHSVVVKGLPIRATPTSRLNVTSVTMVAESCTAPAGKQEEGAAGAGRGTAADAPAGLQSLGLGGVR